MAFRQSRTGYGEEISQISAVKLRRAYPSSGFVGRRCQRPQEGAWYLLVHSSSEVSSLLSRMFMPKSSVVTDANAAYPTKKSVSCLVTASPFEVERVASGQRSGIVYGYLTKGSSSLKYSGTLLWSFRQERHHLVV
jgi:hypothetical protein